MIIATGNGGFFYGVKTMVELKGFKGVSAWLVYNKVIYALPYTKYFSMHRRDFNAELAESLTLSDEHFRIWASMLTEADIPSNKTHAECLYEFKGLPDDVRKLVILDCMTMTDITDDEVMRLVAVHKDQNDIPYSKANINNLQLAEVAPMMIETLCAASNVSVDMMLTTKEDIEALKGGRVDVRDHIAAGGGDVGEILAVATKEAIKEVRK